jgi:hypothetical protein
MTLSWLISTLGMSSWDTAIIKVNNPFYRTRERYVGGPATFQVVHPLVRMDEAEVKELSYLAEYEIFI